MADFAYGNLTQRLAVPCRPMFKQGKGKGKWPALDNLALYRLIVVGPLESTDRTLSAMRRVDRSLEFNLPIQIAGCIMALGFNQDHLVRQREMQARMGGHFELSEGGAWRSL